MIALHTQEGKEERLRTKRKEKALIIIISKGPRQGSVVVKKEGKKQKKKKVGFQTPAFDPTTSLNPRGLFQTITKSPVPTTYIYIIPCLGLSVSG